MTGAIFMASETLQAGHGWYSAAAKAAPNQKIKPRSFSTIKMFFMELDFFPFISGPRMSQHVDYHK